MSGFRLPKGGSAIDRARPLSFSFDGRNLQGFEGDTLASALLGAGVDVVARSFKFHRPRGIRASGWEDPSAWVRIESPVNEANVLATRLPLTGGLRASSQHCWPSLGFDLGALADLVRALLPAGFYYKTFKWPARAWPLYEHLIRRAAGLGRMPDRISAIATERRYHRAAVLVVGGGISGTAAALAAVRRGRSLVWVDDGDQPGGRLRDQSEPEVLGPLEGLARTGAIDGEPALQWLERATAEIDASPNVVRLRRSTALGLYEHGEVLVLERSALTAECVWWLRVDRIVLGTGAFELPLLFEDNDRPGIMLAGAVAHYLSRHAVACGRRVLLAGPRNGLMPLAGAIRSAGLELVGIVDSTTNSVGAVPQGEIAGSAPTFPGMRVARAMGGRRVSAVDLEPRRGSPVGRRTRVSCDLLAVHGGWAPALQLLAHAPGTHASDGSHDWIRPAGMAAGESGASACLLSGWQVACALLEAMSSERPRTSASEAPGTGPIRPAYEPPWVESLDRIVSIPSAARRVFIDLADDVTAADLALAHREGYESPELLKRYTTLGMGPDQGRGVGPIGLAMMARLRGLPDSNLPATRTRPPWVPLAFGTLAAQDPGPLIRPYRETPLTSWHRTAGAVLYESGAHWRRPGYYPRAGETMGQAIARECRAVRQAVGLYDSSPLGKFEISGPHAAAFLERLLPSRIAALAPGRGRYALVMREDGRLLDDGVLFRLAPDRFWLSATAGNTDSVQAWLDYARQWLFRDLGPVVVANVSAQWAALVVCGPRARDVLTRLGTDLPLDGSDFPFMSLRLGQVAGVPVRAFRVSFTGELSYELNVRPRDALALWQNMVEAGRDFGLEAIGSEANHVLRVEKGFISIGHEADGIANPDDLGLGWAVHLDKGDFVGRRSILRDRAQRAPRPELVGLEVEFGAPLEEGAQIVDAQVRLGGSALGPQVPSLGFVTASVDSPTLGRPIALALLEAGRSRIGETVQVTAARAGGPERGHAGLDLRPARVVEPVFFDPEGVRLRG